MVEKAKWTSVPYGDNQISDNPPYGEFFDGVQNLVNEDGQNAMDEAVKSTDYQIGTRVNHTSFGLGHVESTEVAGDGDITLSIRFETDGLVKTLSKKSGEALGDLQIVNEKRAVTIDIKFRTESKALPPESAKKYLEGFGPHFKASIDESDMKPFRKTEAKAHADSGRTLPFILIEDFGTNGLNGDVSRIDEPKPHEREENFYWLFRSEGKSGKRSFEGGSKGVGKQTLHDASRLGAFIGLSVRNSDKQSVLMGKAMLGAHSLDGKRYPPRVYFSLTEANGLQVPVLNGDQIEDFKSDFDSSRGEEPGFSKAILDPFPSITALAVKESFVEVFFYPILKGELTVKLDDNGVETVIDAAHLAETVIALGDRFKHFIGHIELARFHIELPTEDRALVYKNPKDKLPEGPGCTTWFEDDVAEDLKKRFSEGRRIAVRIPLILDALSNDGENETYVESATHFDIILQRDPSLEEASTFYIRDYLRIPNENRTYAPRPRFQPVRALVIAEQGPLASMLRYAEGPSHALWKPGATKVVENYQKGPDVVRFVNRSVSRLVEFLSIGGSEEDDEAFSGFFSAPKITGGGGGGGGGGGSSTPPEAKVEAHGKDGFRVFHDPRKTELTPIKIQFAYNSTRAALSNYQELDFKIDDNVVTAHKELEVIEKGSNYVVVDPQLDIYEITFANLDPNRDVIVDITRYTKDDKDD